MNIDLQIDESLLPTIWGTVEYEDNLIVDFGETMEELQSKMKNNLLEWHELDPAEIEFTVKEVESVE